MSNDDPITHWIRQLEQADEAAAQDLWNHYCARLCAMARSKLTPETRRVYDEEDAALSAFHSLCQRVAEGRFPDLNDRHDLWRVLMVITPRKVSLRHRHDRQEKRDINRMRGDSIFQETDGGNGRDWQMRRSPGSRRPSLRQKSPRPAKRSTAN